LTTCGLAVQLEAWMAEKGSLAFLIGGADGLDAALKKSAAMQLRLSSLTLPHGLARVLLAEQLYRAFSVIGGHPYHRE
jgi:23S rRNA (pseudouridine1915-N3)-methyltransferase